MRGNLVQNVGSQQRHLHTWRTKYLFRIILQLTEDCQLDPSTARGNTCPGGATSLQCAAGLHRRALHSIARDLSHRNPCMLSWNTPLARHSLPPSSPINLHDLYTILY
ncbi:hypothetical protein OBBRIDRAFT_41731 [Obba rivulosa]|uniref:Uncharacterized protein n=1 Tax=Obba rivulosa TaxID=1052685 RepID=A0A8E2AYN8_9APHY|nr:hypothetical protein OBBRIDRAFT_41731 [Obba rivulosa]